MRRYNIRNPDDREYLEHVVLSSADLTEALRDHDVVTADEWRARMDAMEATPAVEAAVVAQIGGES